MNKKEQFAVCVFSVEQTEMTCSKTLLVVDSVWDNEEEARARMNFIFDSEYKAKMEFLFENENAEFGDEKDVEIRKVTQFDEGL